MSFIDEDYRSDAPFNMGDPEMETFKIVPLVDDAEPFDMDLIVGVDNHEAIVFEIRSRGIKFEDNDEYEVYGVYD